MSWAHILSIFHYFDRRTIYSRYNPQDWTLSNTLNYSNSEKERGFAERLRADAWRAVKETDARTRNRQNDVTKRLGISFLIIGLKLNVMYLKKSVNRRLNLNVITLFNRQSLSLIYFPIYKRKWLAPTTGCQFFTKPASSPSELVLIHSRSSGTWMNFEHTLGLLL